MTERIEWGKDAVGKSVVMPVGFDKVRVSLADIRHAQEGLLVGNMTPDEVGLVDAVISWFTVNANWEQVDLATPMYKERSNE